MAAAEMMALIGGSGAERLLASAEAKPTPLGPVDTPFGESTPIFRVRMGDSQFMFLPRHGEIGYQVAAPWVNYRANIYALKEHGVTRILSWSAAAATDNSLRVGQFVLPTDLVDETRGRESSFYKGTGLGVIRQSPAFCPETREAVDRALQLLRLEYRAQGVYVCTQGPRLQTLAEIRNYRKQGANLAGMTLAPEAFLARELEICYAAICYVSGFAEGVLERTTRPGMLFDGMIGEAEQEAVAGAVDRLLGLAAFVQRSLPDERNCQCGVAMERYRREGTIGEDWHTWLGRP
jgi:5'-methylthioadenosine phosphorylase